MVESRDKSKLEAMAAPEGKQDSAVRCTQKAEEHLDELCALHTRDLTVGYEGVPLISDIEIKLHPGEMLTLIGPNGAGKSTILKSLAKYLEPVGGSVFIGKRDLHEMSPKDLSTEMSVVLTGRLSTELMTCRDVVETGRYPYTGRLGILSDDDHRIVEESMSLVNVIEIADKDFTQISDGQRQRVLLARAICQKPRIIVLDEPTSFLDVHYKLELLGLLRNLAKAQGIAVIMSLHELDLAQKISDTIMCVKGERILRYGAPQDIFTRETIHELYSLDNGCYNPLFGSVELAAVPGDPHVFVIAGAGTGIATYRLLQRESIPFATGVLFDNDIDYVLACDLSHHVAASPAFHQASDESLAQARALIDEAKVIICCVSEDDPLNPSNARLLEYAREKGKRIIDAASGLSLEDVSPLRACQGAR